MGGDVGPVRKNGKKGGNGNAPEPAIKSLGEKVKAAELHDRQFTEKELRILEKFVAYEKGAEELIRDAFGADTVRKIVKSKPPEERKRFAELYFRTIKPEETIIFHVEDIDGKERLECYVGPGEKHLIDAISSLDSEKVPELKDELKKIAEKSQYESVRKLAEEKLKPVDEELKKQLLDGIKEGNLLKVELAVCMGADINTLDSEGFSALSLSILENQRDIAEFLHKKGAKLKYNLFKLRKLSSEELERIAVLEAEIIGITIY